MTTTKTATYTWQPQADGGHKASDGRASLAKLEKTAWSEKGKMWRTKRSWFLILRDGREFDLGKKASFTTAERIMTREGAC